MMAEASAVGPTRPNGGVCWIAGHIPATALKICSGAYPQNCGYSKICFSILSAKSGYSKICSGAYLQNCWYSKICSGPYPQNCGYSKKRSGAYVRNSAWGKLIFTGFSEIQELGK